jgi:hypothetical protein
VRVLWSEVGRAIQAHTRAIARLIRWLKHPDEAVRSEASAALKGLDPPPPTWALGEALLGSRDRPFRLRIIKVLVALAAVDQVRVVCVLCEAFKQRRDLEVKHAVATALLVLVTERLGQGPSPAEDHARDLDLESTHLFDLPKAKAMPVAASSTADVSAGRLGLG